MTEIFAKNVRTDMSHDVEGGKPVYVIRMYGEGGLLSVYGIKKQQCEVREPTLKKAKEHCQEIRDWTRKDRRMERNMYQEMLGYEVEYDENGNEVPRYTDHGNEGKFRDKQTGEMKLRYENNKLVLRVDEEGNVLPKYDCEGNEIPYDKRPEAVVYLEEQERLRLEAEAAAEAEAEVETEAEAEVEQEGEE